MYRFISVGDRLVEVCDECGFNGSRVEIGDVSTRLNEVRRAWSAVALGEEDLLRNRPAPATWCALEYAEHTAFALGAIEWGAREFVQRRAPDWTLLPSDRLGDASDDNHDCAPIAIDQVLHVTPRSDHPQASPASIAGARSVGVRGALDTRR